MGFRRRRFRYRLLRRGTYLFRLCLDGWCLRGIRTGVCLGFDRFLDSYRRFAVVVLFRPSSLGTVAVLVAEPPLDRERYVLIDGAGMSLFFLNAKLRQQLQYPVGLDFQLPSQLIDSDFQLHR
jgi:hypothetical protein